jgi:hypothetical protein
LPYEGPKTATRSITVVKPVLTLDPLPAYVKVGDVVHFKGQLTINDVGVSGAPIEIYRAGVKLTSGTTGAGGYYDISWTVPFTHDTAKLPCLTHSFAAYHPPTDTWSSGRSMKIAYPTRIRDFTAPSVVGVNTPFTASGYLEFQDVDGVWKGLANRTVNIYYNTTLIGPASTGSDGKFEKTDCKIPSTGTYTLKAEFAGEGLYAPTVALLGLEVPSEVVVEPITWLGALSPLIATVGIVAAHMLIGRR